MTTPRPGAGAQLPYVVTGRPVVIGTTRPGPAGVVLPGAGTAGRGISGAMVNAQGHLVLSFTDGTTQDVGNVAPEVRLTPEQLAALASQVSYVHEQLQPATVWTVLHGLGRGMVSVEVYSSDYSIQWDNVLVQPVDDDTVRLGFDDPTAGFALVL